VAKIDNMDKADKQPAAGKSSKDLNEAAAGN